jgi:hypothetical protein
VTGDKIFAAKIIFYLKNPLEYTTIYFQMKKNGYFDFNTLEMRRFTRSKA